MNYFESAIVLCASLVCADASIDIQRAGWLDRVVHYHKNKFFKDVANLPPVQLKASLVKRPPGYEESSAWDFDSAVRLLTLVRESEQARPVARALRRMLSNTRRLFMTKQDSYKFFPSIDAANYYDSQSIEVGVEGDSPGPQAKDLFCDDDIVRITNPVEARLPSTHISVRTLKAILEARAEMARQLPSTTHSTIYWKTSSGGETDGTTAADNSTAAADGNKTEDAKNSTSNDTAGSDTAGNDTSGSDPAGSNTAGNDTAGNGTGGNGTNNLRIRSLRTRLTKKKNVAKNDRNHNDRKNNYGNNDEFDLVAPGSDDFYLRSGKLAGPREMYKLLRAMREIPVKTKNSLHRPTPKSKFKNRMFKRMRRGKLLERSRKAKPLPGLKVRRHRREKKIK